MIPAGLNSGAYTRFLVDATIGVLFAYVLLVHFLTGERRAALPHVFLGCMMLVLTKNEGIALALCACVGIMGVGLLFGRRALAESWKKNKFICALGFGAPAWGILLGQLSWKLYQALNHVVPKWDTGEVGFASVRAMLGGTAPAYRYGVLRDYGYNLLHVRGDGATWLPFAPIVWFLLYALLAAALVWAAPKAQRMRYAFFAGGVALTHLVFLAGLLVNYLFIFTEIDAVPLASFFRYQASVVTGCMLFYIVALWVVVQAKPLWHKAVAAVVCIGMTLWAGRDLPAVLHTLAFAPTEAAQTQHERYISIHAAERVAALGEAHPRLYLVSMIDDGFAMMRLNYELLPITLADSSYCTTIATGDYYGDTLGVQVYSVQEWAAALYRDFDYVYLHNIDGNFTTYYRELFENEDDIVNDVMLEVVRHDDGSVTLRHMYTEADIAPA